MKVVEIPKNFKERYGPLVDNPEKFFECCMAPLPRAFRVNTLKAKVKDVVKRFEGYGVKLIKVPWYKDAFVSDTAKIVGSLDGFVGNIYVQELTSMIPVLAVEKELKKAELVLDGCAAPGSKTTQISTIMKNKGLIVANELGYIRIKALKFNIEKQGALNVAVTNMDLNRFPRREFDVVFVDAPCSSEGTCRKNWKTFLSWSERDIKNHSKVQRKLIKKGYELVKKGGVLVYSTCTFAPEENELVVNYLLSEVGGKLEKIELKGLKTSEGITSFNGRDFSDEVKKCIRVWPHHNDTGGFFVAKVRKC